MTKRKPIEDKLRTAMQRAEGKGVTRYRLAQASGVSQSTLSDFARGKTSLRLPQAEAVAEALGKKIDLT